MITLIIAIFVLGYACIAFEHKIKVDKAATSLAMFGLIWMVYAIFSGGAHVGEELMEHLGSTCETLVFLIGAMTVVEIIDTHGGFFIILKKITTGQDIEILMGTVLIIFYLFVILMITKN